MSEEDDDKQYVASEQKLRRAREEGDIPRSAELGSALMYLGFWAAMALAATSLAPAWTRMAARALGAEPWPDGRGKSVMDLARALTGNAMLAVLGFVAVIAVPVLAGLILQRAFTFTPKKLLPDPGRIDPMRNAGQKLGRAGLSAFGISVAKVGLLGAGGVLLFRSLLGGMLSAGGMSDLQWVDGLRLVTTRAIHLALAIGVGFALIDLLWKHLDYQRRHRMSRQEMQDEHKDSEGDPHLKAARRQKGIDIALNSMLADVERADVVIVNPTHYAVALEWKRGSGRAPVCLAKGVDEIARQIRERASRHQVPIWSDPPCARALHATVEIGQEIRSEHFAPVAAAIRFAEAMRRKVRQGWGGSPAARPRASR
ncbi:flagellar type III secretion system protein FlhB [Paracoccus sp. KR1-242]|uniref:flagellar type III secretion system protein FlhB n=1 Tax=Paracoccus sp. KR1-242 TaxID=3410028 RepID=UPI003C0214C2